MKARKTRYGTGITTHLISLYALDRERAQYIKRIAAIGAQIEKMRSK